MGGICGMYGEDKKFIQNFSWKPQQKRPFGRSRLRWEYNMKILNKYGIRVWTGLNWSKIGFSLGL
jgi:hypothetical protein